MMKKIFQLATAALFCACTEIETLEFVKSENTIEEMESNPTQSQSALNSECVTYRRPINFFYTGSTQENINIRIELNTKDLIDNNKLNSDCSDLRVLSAEEKISYWVADNSCNTDATSLWVKVPEVRDGVNDLTVCYGDSTLDNESDSYAVFPVFFDDFNDGNIPEDYTKIGSVTENGGTLNVTGTSSYSRVSTNIPSPEDASFSIIKKVRFSSVGSSGFAGTAIRVDGTGFNSYSMTTSYSNINDSNLTSHAGAGAISTDTDFIIEYGYQQSSFSRKCISGCSWNTTRVENPNISFGTTPLLMTSTYSGYSLAIDYLFYANNLPGVAPIVNVQEESTKCHIPEDPFMYESVELVDCDTNSSNIFAAACVATCKDNPSLSPIVICSMEDGEFMFTGCF